MLEKMWFDFEKMPTDALEGLLHNDCMEPQKSVLSDVAILQICKILAKRRTKENPDSIVDVEKK